MKKKAVFNFFIKKEFTQCCDEIILFKIEILLPKFKCLNSRFSFAEKEITNKSSFFTNFHKIMCKIGWLTLKFALTKNTVFKFFNCLKFNNDENLFLKYLELKFEVKTFKECIFITLVELLKKLKFKNFIIPNNIALKLGSNKKLIFFLKKIFEKNIMFTTFKFLDDK